MLFLYRPDCKECIMVKNWLDKYGVEYTMRDMNAAPPTGEEILEWSEKGRLPLKSFLRPRKFSIRMILLSNQMLLAERHTRAYIIAAAAFVLVALLDVSVFLVILLCALAGLICSLATERRRA